MSKNSPSFSYGLIRKVFSIFIAAMPLFASYYSGLPGFTVCDVGLVFFTLISLFVLNHSVEYSFNVTIMMVGVVVIIVVSMISIITQSFFNFAEPPIRDIFIRIIRYAFYVFVALFVCKKLLNIHMLVKSVVDIALIATAFLIVQVAMYRIFGVYIKGTVSFIPLYVDGYNAADRMVFGDMFRATSFFLEPAHYSRYAAIALSIILFKNKTVKNKDIVRGVFISAGIILSTSSQGYILLALIWFVFIFIKLQHIQSAFAMCLAIVVICLSPILLYIVLKIPVVSLTLKRSLDGLSTGQNAATEARLGGIKYFLNLPAVYKIIGMGFGNIPDKSWMSSAAYWLYGGGLVTFCVFFIFMVKGLLKLNGFNRMIFLCYCLLFISDDSYYSYMLILFLSLSLFKMDNSKSAGVKNEKEKVLFTKQQLLGL